MNPETIRLEYREGSSDKVYEAALETNGRGWSVTFAYGRRGSALKAGVKAENVEYAAAKTVFDKIVKEKLAKGYHEAGSASGSVMSGSAPDCLIRDLIPQLPVDVEEAQVALLIGQGWMLQEKKDGENRVIRIADHGLIVANKRGLPSALPVPVAAAATALGPCVANGELIGDTLFLFDLLEAGAEDLRNLGWRDRNNRLLALAVPGPALEVVPAYAGPEALAQFARLRTAGAEGVVLKCPSAPYAPGKTGVAGGHVKFKFVAEASCRVAGRNGTKRSVSLELLEEGRWIGVGNVTVPANLDVPEPGSIVEVRYLYAYPGGSLYQPVLKGVRSDVEPAECAVGQLKYKAG